MPTNTPITPPKWADRFLKWYCHRDVLEEIQGDTYELFARRVNEGSRFKANRLFVWDVIRFLRSTNIKDNQSSNNTAMIRNYYKVGFRGLKKNKISSIINLSGLSISIGIAITVFMFVDFYLSIDKFHKNLDEIYYVQSDRVLSTKVQRYATTPAPLKEIIEADVPSLEKVARIIDKDGIIRFEDEVYYDQFRFADPDFLEIFTFPLGEGTIEAAHDKSKVILSKKIAERLFGNEAGVGKMISITINDERREFEVGGVAKKFPEQASFSFGILIPFENQKGWIDTDYTKWNEVVNATFIQLKPGVTTDGVARTLTNSLTIHNEANPERPIENYHIEPLVTASRNSFDVSSSILFGNHPGGVYGLLLISVFLLALTCINYTNIAVSAASSRLKEIALRKTIGGNRKELIYQFLVENLILCSLSLLVAFALAWVILLPALNQMVPITFPFVLELRFWIFLLTLLVITCLVSGAYPALYISKFQPVEIFRGKEKFGKSIFSKVMLTIQFAIALNLITSAFIFHQNEEYQKELDWGYNGEQKIDLSTNTHEIYRSLADDIQLNPNVIKISGAKNHFGKSSQRSTVIFGEKQYQVRLIEAGPDYLSFMGVNLRGGSYFDPEKESDYLESAIINESFMKALGWDSWEGKIFTYDSSRYHVIGLVQDFHYHSFYSKIYPAFFKPVKEDQYRYLVATIEPGSAAATEEYVRDIWRKNLPDLPYAGFYQDSVFDFFFEETKANAGLMKFLGMVAIILSCMGLYGLVSFNISKRMKEYSVRKILGASAWSIFKRVNRSFVLVLIIAILMAAPLTYVLMKGLITAIYKYYAPIDFIPFALAFLVLLGTVLITISTQMFKVFRANPVDALRNE